MPLEEAAAQALEAAARAAAQYAYAPYSRFAVGAALLFDDGGLVTGANVENASYGLSSCAERNALFRAVAEKGPGRRIIAVAVAHEGPAACPPCGACLQVLNEFAAPDCTVLFSEGPRMRHVTLHELMPVRFSHCSL
jgi:cytidine deaminase